MPRKNTPPIPKSRQPKPDPRRNQKKKPCSFCAHGTTFIDYKDIKSLGKYLSDRGKIRGRRVSGNCQQHQRDITEAIKTARELAAVTVTIVATAETVVLVTVMTVVLARLAASPTRPPHQSNPPKSCLTRLRS